MINARIGIFDSGVGGLTVAREIRKLLPKEGLLYVADNGRAPYGPQSQENILAYSREITRFLLDRGAQLIVVACNTATSAAIKQLRKEFPAIPFVGMEPAVKPAAANSQNNKIGVMATELTLKGDRYQQLVERYAPGMEMYTNPCKGLVPLIENGNWESAEIQEKLEEVLTPMLDAGIDTLVLGCTHYPFLSQRIATICGDAVHIIDPAPAAARQTVRLLADLPHIEQPDYKPLDCFYASGNSRSMEIALGHLDWKWRMCTGNVA